MKHDPGLAPGGASPDPQPHDHDDGPLFRTSVVEHLGCPRFAIEAVPIEKESDEDGPS